MDYPKLTKRVYNALSDGLPETAPPYYWEQLSHLQEWGLRWPHEHGRYGVDLLDRVSSASYWVCDYESLDPKERSLGISSNAGTHSAIMSAARATGRWARSTSSFGDECKHNAMRFLIWTLHEMERRPEAWGIADPSQSGLFNRPQLRRHERLRLWMAGGEVAEKLDRFKHQRTQYAIGNREDPPDVMLGQAEAQWALSIEYKLTRSSRGWSEGVSNE